MYIRRQLVLMIYLSLFASPAFAYFDPNTGGYIFQLLAPLLAMAMSAWMFFAKQVKVIWYSIRSFFIRKKD
jgi:hypothetical protein